MRPMHGVYVASEKPRILIWYSSWASQSRRVGWAAIRGWLWYQPTKIKFFFSISRWMCCSTSMAIWRSWREFRTGNACVIASAANIRKSSRNRNRRLGSARTYCANCCPNCRPNSRKPLFASDDNESPSTVPTMLWSKPETVEVCSTKRMIQFQPMCSGHCGRTKN